MENLNHQFINTLNGQKEKAEMEILNRDRIIDDLNLKNETIQKEFLEKKKKIPFTRKKISKKKVKIIDFLKNEEVKN